MTKVAKKVTVKKVKHDSVKRMVAKNVPYQYQKTLRPYRKPVYKWKELFPALKIGESFYVNLDTRNNTRHTYIVNTACRYYSRTRAAKFSYRSTPCGGARIWRIG